jgi:hypothetical protein
MRLVRRCIVILEVQVEENVAFPLSFESHHTGADRGQCFINNVRKKISTFFLKIILCDF